MVLLLLAVSLITVSFRGNSSFHLPSLKGDVADVIDPIRGVVDDIFQPVVNMIHGIGSYPSTVEKERALQREVNSLRQRRYENGAAESALAQLTRLDHLPFGTNFQKITAEVVGLSPTNLQLSFEIDEGSAAGVVVGDPVVGGEGLAGRVVEVSKTASTVLMLQDPNSVVAVRIGKTGQLGALTGQGSGVPMAVSLVVPGTPLHKGEILYTSSTNGALFPAGLPAGRVVSFSNPQNALQESIRVAPLFDPDTTTFVTVLEWVKP